MANLNIVENPNKEEEEIEEEEEDFIYSKCKTCGFRVGSHTLTESYQCKLITKEEYDKYSKKN